MMMMKMKMMLLMMMMMIIIMIMMIMMMMIMMINLTELGSQHIANIVTWGNSLSPSLNQDQNLASIAEYCQYFHVEKV